MWKMRHQMAPNGRRSGIRIILVLSYDSDAQAVASLVRRESMTSGWGWLVLYEVISVPAMAGWVYFRPFFSPEGMPAFAEQVSDYSKSYFNLTVGPESVDTYSVAMYEAIMLYAHAVTKLMSEGGSLRDGEAVTRLCGAQHSRE